MVLFLRTSLSTLELVTLIVVLAIALALITFLIISIHVRKYHDTKYAEKLGDLTTSVRIYIIDLKNDVVKYFNRSDLKNIKTSSVVDFYNQFRVDERARLIKWVSDVVNPSAKASSYFEVNTIERVRHKERFSILQIQKIDYGAQIIHLESYLLRLSNESLLNRAIVARNTKKDRFYHDLSLSGSRRGAIALFNFYFKDDGDDSRSEFPHLIFAQIRNLITNYINEDRRIIQYNDHTIILADLSIQTKPQMLVLLSEIRNEIKRLLLLYSHKDAILYTISCVEVKHFPGDVNGMIDNALEIAKFNEEEDNYEVTWYEVGHRFESKEDPSAYRTEVERLIRDNRISYKYRAIYDAERAKIYGYEVFIKPIDSFFETIEELKNYALKTNDDRELFSTITRKCISHYISEKDEKNLRLFFPISYKERPYVIRTLSHIQKIKDMHLVIVLSESELTSISGLDEEELVSTLRSFKSKGYEVALYFTSYDTPFSKKVYASFDFYLIDIKETLYDKNGKRTLTTLRGFAEKLIHYHKTIISTNIPTWDAVELMIRLGLGHVSSETIAPSDEMILPVSPKTAQKIKKVVESQGDKYGK